MIAPAPHLEIRPYDEDDAPRVRSLVNRWLSVAPWSLPLDADDARRQLLAVPPPSEFGARLQEPLRLCAWRAGEVVGYFDGLYGAASDALDLPEQSPQGLIRFVAPQRGGEHGGERPGEHAADILRLLLAAAEAHWLDHKVEQLVAFHPSTGFRSFQMGAGVLPGEWAEHVRQFTAAGWLFRQRYYALARRTGAPLEEECPAADISLVQQRTAQGRSYAIYYRRVELIAHARVLGLRLDRSDTAELVLRLLDLEVAELWRNRNVGKWLLRRILNDAAHGGYREVIAFLPTNLPIALNLLIQNGFEETNYRGYTLEKQLPRQEQSAHPLRFG